jgi:hypothetical protein
MALKNTYAKLGAGRYIQDAQEALVKAGAIGIQSGYEDGRITTLAFVLDLNGQRVQFKLPVNWRNFQRVLKKEQNRRADEDDYAYKVAWACTKDWIEAQMAFVESENVTLPQIFLPYVVVKGGKTLFEKVITTPDFLLGDGK